ncbi:UNVERIFIED_CONTAM: hypothetical protein FKN15_013307 [Acipenser sinensis]
MPAKLWVVLRVLVLKPLTGLQEWNRGPFHSSFNRKEHHDLTLSLREIAALLPVTGTAHSRRISKKDTLVHVLRYLEYLQSHIDFLETLLPGCDSGPSEPRTPPLNRKSAQQESVCSRPRKRQPASRGEGAGRGTGRGACLSQISGPLRRTVPALPVESSEAVRRVDLSEARSSTLHTLGCDSGPSEPRTPPLNRKSAQQESVCSRPRKRQPASRGGVSVADLRTPAEDCPCSACGELGGSEEGRPVRSQVFDSPHAGSGGLLLKDHMLWWYPSSGEDEPPLTPSFPPHPSTGSSPLQTLCFVEGLNLSPSLLTSPARDLALSFLQEGQENLHVLFEDVWVSAMHSTESQEHSTDNTAEWDSLLGGGWLSSASEGEERGDFTWTPSKRGPPRGGRGRHRPRPRRPLYAKPHLKKKCVNGFIMYCRLNRKSYLRSHPGIPSTVVTKKLAVQWHNMSKQERRGYWLVDSADSRTAMYAACGARGRGSWRGRERDQGRERERGSRRKEEGEQEREEEGEQERGRGGAGEGKQERERGTRREGEQERDGEGKQERGEAGERDTRREGEQEKEGGEPPQRSDQSRLFRGDSGELLSIGPAAEEHRDRLSVTHYLDTRGLN